MAGWKERLRGTIDLTSPSGKFFQALWIGDEVEMKKYLGVSKYPNIDGAYIQDQGVGGVGYPLTIYFDGPDNDLLSQSFFQECREKDEWKIVHPVLGELKLVLTSVKKGVRPVTSGNVAVFNTQWIEGIARTKIISIPLLQK